MRLIHNTVFPRCIIPGYMDQGNTVFWKKIDSNIVTFEKHFEYLENYLFEEKLFNPVYRKVLPIKPGVDPKRLEIKTGLNFFEFFKNLV